MSTHSTISLYSDGYLQSQYCHFDGYLYHNGNLLLNNYTTQEKVQDLLNFGDMSILEQDTASCTFYARDRNESIQIRTQPIGIISNPKHIIPIFEEEYNYLFFNNQWYFYEMYSSSQQYFKPLTINLITLFKGM